MECPHGIYSPQRVVVAQDSEVGTQWFGIPTEVAARLQHEPKPSEHASKGPDVEKLKERTCHFSPCSIAKCYII